MIRLGFAAHAERVTRWVRGSPPLGPSRLHNFKLHTFSPQCLDGLSVVSNADVPLLRDISRGGFRIARPQTIETDLNTITGGSLTFSSCIGQQPTNSVYI